MAPSTYSTLLIIAEHFQPAVRAGGPVRSLQHLVDWLGQEYQFSVCTRDRDLGDQSTFPEIRANEWIQTDGGRIMYLSPEEMPGGLDRALGDVQPGMIYLNSFFAPMSRHVLWSRRRGGFGTAPLLLAPRGEFNPGALSLKRWKKAAYLWLARASGLCRDVSFHATNDEEKEEIRRLFGPSARVHVAANLGPKAIPVHSAPPPKAPGAVKLVFLSRLVPKKNLHFLLPLLARMQGHVELAIWGPTEDADYAANLRSVCSQLPGHVRVKFEGEVRGEDVWSRLAQAHFLVLPTLGENHGHAIVEAWQAGLPVLISDRTPWRGLAEKQLGWDLSLESPERWVATLQACVGMDDPSYQTLRHAVDRHAQQLLANPPLDDWRRMFSQVCQSK